MLLALCVWMVGMITVDCQQQCISCPTGKYKSSNANTPCTSCPRNRYRNATGGVTESDCFFCPLNSMSNESTPDIIGCKCLPGFYMTNAYTCETCPFGKFKSDLSNNACTDCPGPTTSEFRGSISPSNCSCAPGFGWSGSACGACAIGTYKNAIGNIGCSGCGPNSTSPSGSTMITNCSCVAGYTGMNGGVCSACTVGKYKIASGDQACANCPSDSSSVSASVAMTACKCNAGYSGPDGGTCTACSMGKYKNVTLSQCMNCPANTYSNKTATVSISDCAPCRTFSSSLEGSASEHSCFCNLGYFTDVSNRTCTACVPGKFMQFGSAACSDCGAGKFAAGTGSTSLSACLTCEVGKFSRTNQSQCDPCPDGTSSNAGSGLVTDCNCNIGFYPLVPATNGGTCAACLAGTFKASRGTAVCTPFQSGTYGNLLGATDQKNASACTGNSNSPAGSTLVTQCSCNLGYTGAITTTASICSGCVAGKFKNTTGAGVCVDCPKDTYSSETAKTNSSCLSCGDYAISSPGSASSAACSCSAGYGIGS